jgi:pyrroline-5-carboxylate reductase
MKQTIGFIGGGHMTAAIVGGLVQVISPELIYVSNRGQQKLEALASRYDIRPANSNSTLVERCDVVVLSVKPQVLQSVLEPLSEVFQHRKPLVISVAAGITCASIERWLGAKLPLIRSMPNVPSVIGEGATGLFAGAQATDDHKAIAQSIFDSIGLSAWVNQETDLDLVTAISGSGPAYAMLFLQSMIEAAERRGMSSEAAKTLALQTMRGTAGMVLKSDKALPQMLEDMLLPGGTTEQAVAALRELDVPKAIDKAVGAAHQRAAELAKELADTH